MAIKLIYHDNESSEGGVSPFHKIIKEIVKDKNISIVCPYIGIDIFEDITQLSNSWQLISDIKEWIKSDRTNALRIKNYIMKNSLNVHNYPDIHAKVIITDNNTLIGSANLTEKGLTGRVEMCVLIEDKEIVAKMQKWFCDIWNKSGGNEPESINIQHLEQFVNSIMSVPSHNLNESKISIPSKAPAIKAKLAEYGKENIQVDNIIKNNKKSHQCLIEAMKLTSNRGWINSYFDLAKELIEFTGLTSDDPRLVMSITKNKKIPISINQRWVLKPLKPYYNGNIGLIMPLEYDSQNYGWDLKEKIKLSFQKK